MLDPEKPCEQMKPYDQSRLDELLQQNDPHEQDDAKNELLKKPENTAANGCLSVGILFALGCICPFGGLFLLGDRGIFPFHQPLLPNNQYAQMIWWACSAIAGASFLFFLFLAFA